LRISGGRRYAVALVVDALGAGLLRPFLLLYGIAVLGLKVGAAGLALSAGVLVGLVALPLTGRWIDRGARSAPAATTLLIRAAGAVALCVATGPVGFGVAAIVLGVGNQSWSPAHTAMVTTLADERHRDAALAAGRSLRNAGMGAGALIATLTVAGGVGALRALAVLTALAYLTAAGLVASMRVTARPSRPADTAATGPDRGLRAATVLGLANLPYALCFDVLEVALPALVVTYLHASPAWSAGMFVANTVLVIAVQVPMVLWLARHSRRAALAGAGLVLAGSYVGFWFAGMANGQAGGAALAVVSVVYTFGEILYTGSGPALVAATTPPHLLGRALTRWQLSTGVGQAIAPAVLTAMLSSSPALMWGVLTVVTLLGAAAIHRGTPLDR
jgi:MFS family permease